MKLLEKLASDFDCTCPRGECCCLEYQEGFLDGFRKAREMALEEMSRQINKYGDCDYRDIEQLGEQEVEL